MICIGDWLQSSIRRDINIDWAEAVDVRFILFSTYCPSITFMKLTDEELRYKDRHRSRITIHRHCNSNMNIFIHPLFEKTTVFFPSLIINWILNDIKVKPAAVMLQITVAILRTQTGIDSFRIIDMAHNCWRWQQTYIDYSFLISWRYELANHLTFISPTRTAEEEVNDLFSLNI